MYLENQKKSRREKYFFYFLVFIAFTMFLFAVYISGEVNDDVSIQDCI